MKKLICICLLLCTVFAFFGCEAEPASQPVPPGETTGQDAATTAGQAGFDPVDSVLTLGDMTGVYGALFGNGRVIDIAITLSETDLAAMNASPVSGTYYPANITVNGIAAERVGITPEDDLSLSLLAQSDSTRYSLRVKADCYTEGQTLNGLDELVLNNLFGDPTYMRAYLYGLAVAHIGGTVPFMAYANVTVNGTPAGLYLCTEAAADSYAERIGGQGSSVTETDELPQAVYDALASGEEEAIGALLDVDSFLRYFAADAYLGNYHGYLDAEVHGYALVSSNGKYIYTEGNAGLAMGAYHNDGGRSVTADIYSPVFLCDLGDRPLLSGLLECDTYCDTYLDYIEDLVYYFEDPEALTASIDALIGTYVQEDATAFYSYEDYRSGIVFSGVELSELLGDPGNVLVDPIGGDDEPDDVSPVGPEDPTPESYAQVKGMVDYIHQRTTSVVGQLGLS